MIVDDVNVPPDSFDPCRQICSLFSLFLDSCTVNNSVKETFMLLETFM